MISPRKEILGVLDLETELTWAELQSRTSLSKGALSKHLKVLLNERKIVSEPHPEDRRVTLYRKMNEGEWEHRVNKTTDFLSSFDNPVAVEIPFSGGEKQVHFAFNVGKNMSLEDKEALEEKMNRRLNSSAFRWAIENLLKISLKAATDSKAYFTIFFDPDVQPS